MLFAQDGDGKRIKAMPAASAVCPLCFTEMIPKCGEIKVWHWAHRRKDCDGWSDGETEWHLFWKSLMPPENVEVIIERDGIKHRADIVTRSGMVVELQHSSMSVDEIAEREQFYGNMAWLFDVRRQAGKRLETIRLMQGGLVQEMQLELFPVSDPTGKPWFWLDDFLKQPNPRRLETTRTIRWYWPLNYVLSAQKPRYLDLGDERLLRLMSYKAYFNRGWGYFGHQKEFTDWLTANGGSGLC